ncbi:hypothetical protein TRFO_39991 [Tritrichomonas foetus]|uniref:Uncharacterized protein n=1 Tax=Tritrichomonas foetus TaxID=1144522 RepID=A0A1J4J7T4_9EUKA|nr:hypothetical protein TRFO_39991 [Tritrichomonas foetus]|eukprot:OHS93723.1 hypothetical protein TRFO_39991 [Tritrichomonas foetus]
MSALAIVGGVIMAVKAGVEIASAFKTTCQTSVIGTVTPQGFNNFYGYSSIANKSIAATSMGTYLERMLDRIEITTHDELKKNKEDLLAELKEIKDFESYDWGDCSNLVNTVEYNEKHGVIYFYIYQFSPFMHPSNGKAVNILTLQMMARVDMPKSYMIVNKVKTNLFKVQSANEIQYLPSEGIALKNVIESIAICFAPAALGIVTLPPSFMTIMNDFAMKELSNKTSYPNVTADQQKVYDQQFKEAAARQKEWDEETRKGLDDLSGLIQKFSGSA